MNKLTKIFCWLSGLVISLVLISILGDIILNSLESFNLTFLYQVPMSAGRRGGIYPIIISTLLITGISTLVTVPIGTLCAIYLSRHYPSTLVFKKFIKRMIQVLSGVPSIVFGLFGNAIFCTFFGLGFSILSGALTLSCMCLPLFITSVEEGVSSIPDEVIHTTHSLGFSLYTTFKSIVLPLAIPSILSGLVLSVGRALAETAALIFTSGYVDRFPESLLDSGRALSVHIYDLAMNVPGGDQNAYKSSMVLIGLILIINSVFNIIAKIISKEGQLYE